jgi:hypothetical protein
MKRYLVAYATNSFTGSVHFYSKIVCADTIGDAIMQIQNESRQVVNVIPLGSLD